LSANTREKRIGDVLVTILLLSGIMVSNGAQEGADVPGNKSDRQFELLSRFTILILFLIVSIFFFPIMRIFFIPIVIAAVFAGLLYPVYKFLYKIFWKKPFLASFLTCLMLILIVLIPSFFILQNVIVQMREFYSMAVSWFQEFSKNWQDYPLVTQFMNSKIGKWLIEDVDWSSFINTLSKNLTSIATLVINKTYTGVFGLVVDMVIMLFTLFYFLIDGETILKRIRYLLPLKEHYLNMAFSSFYQISKAIIKGTIIIGLIVGFFSAITLLIFGIDAWLFWGFVIVICSIIPLFGPSLVMIPTAIFKFLDGQVWQGVGILLITFIILVNIDNVLRPRIVGGSAKMHDLLVFFSTLGGISVFGITGFIIGPIIAALFLTVLKIYSEEFKPQLTRRDLQSKNGNT
jgi:predicted PurR-regulated permease PerM